MPAKRAMSHGQALVEFALITPVFLLMLLLAIDFGRIFFTYVEINNGAREAAAYAAANPTDLGGMLAKAQQETNVQGQAGQGAVSISATCTGPGEAAIDCATAAGGGGTGNTITVTATEKFTFFTPFRDLFFGNPVPGQISSDPNSPCYPSHLTPGSLNMPGAFGWLDFGCNGYGLGQGSDGGCSTSKTFLQTEIGPPGNSFGCCTQTGLAGSLDQIGSLPGNKVSPDCSSVYGKIVTIAVWDTAGGTDSNSWYHIVGFTGFQITNCDGGKDLEGVWRQPFSYGPTTTTPGFAGQPLAVELVR